MGEPQLPAKNIASLIGVSVARVGQLRDDGVITMLDNRKYPISAVTQYVEWLRGNKQDASQSKNFAILLEKEKYREKKRQNDLEEKLVANVELLSDALEKCGKVMIPTLESLPLLMKRYWPGITGDQIMLVKKAIAECRNAIADMEIDLDD